LFAVRLCAAVKGVPVITTHDGRTIRYPDPNISPLDTVKIDLATGKVLDFIKFDNGAQVLITGGRNTGRVGHIVHREKHPGNFDIVHIKDAAGHEVCLFHSHSSPTHLDFKFATRLGNVFVVGKGAGSKAWITLPKGQGQKLTVAEERDRRLQKK
jgi:small subunit ribosomal protein S4e